MKYGSRAVSHAGYSFASKLEAGVFDLLRLRELAKDLVIECSQDKVYLSEAKILYIADFKCRDCKTNKEFWVESKGFETPEWRIKRRLWIAYGPGKLEIWKGSYKKPFLAEVIGPD